MTDNNPCTPLTPIGPAVREGADWPRRDPFIFIRLVGSSKAPTPVREEIIPFLF